MMNTQPRPTTNPAISPVVEVVEEVGPGATQ